MSAKLKNSTDKCLLSIGKKKLHLRKKDGFPVDTGQFWIGVNVDVDWFAVRLPLCT
jgi:hypothetical protein